jgi:transposase InsO family protein
MRLAARRLNRQAKETFGSSVRNITKGEASKHQTLAIHSIVASSKVSNVFHTPMGPGRPMGNASSLRDLDIWAYQKGVVLDFSRPGKPTDNSFIQSFNGKFRSECLNTHWFLSLDAQRKIGDNEVRPHSAIGHKVPISLLNGSSAPPPR